MNGQVQLKTKGLFVGLGGTGKLALLQLKRKFQNIGIDTVANPKISLLSIDYDNSREELAVKSSSNGNVIERISLESGEYLFLDTDDIENRIRDISGQYNIKFYKDWYPDMQGEAIKFGILKGGAAQWRPLGRVGLYEHADHIFPILREKMDNLMKMRASDESGNRDEQVLIYIIASMGGGTGAGTFIDTAYYLRSIAPHSPIYALLLLPNAYKKWDQHGRLYANSYAMLKEMNVFANQSRRFAASYPDGTIIDVARNQRAPIDLMFLFDNQIGKNMIASDPEEILELLADTIFVDVYGSSLYDEQVSYLTNLSKSTGKLSLDNLSEKCIVNAMGSTSIVFPDSAEIRVYLEARFASDVLLRHLLKRGDGQPEEKGKDNGTAQTVSSFETTANDLSLGQEEDAVSLTLTATKADIEKAKQTLLNALPQWTPDQIKGMAADMYLGIEQSRGSHDACKDKLDSWKDKFLLANAGEELKFPTAPYYLPNETAAGGFGKGLDDFKQQIRKQVKYLQDRATGSVEKERVDQKIQEQFGRLSEELAAEHKLLQEDAERLLNDPTGNYGRILSDLKQLIASKPWNIMGQAELSFTSLFIRLLETAFSSLYNTFIKKVRVNLYLANAITDIVSSQIKTEAKDVLEVRRALQSIKDHLERAHFNIREHLIGRTQSTRLTESYISDSDYLGTIWEKASYKVYQRVGDIEQLLEELDKFANAKHSISNITRCPDMDLVGRCFADFARLKIGQLITDGDLDPLSFLLDDLGIEKLEGYLRKARNDHFINNRVANPNQVVDIFISIPVSSDQSRKDGHLAEKLKTVVTHLFTATNIHDVYVPHANRMIVKFISLNHPTYNLENIDKFYSYYQSYGENRKMFHLDASYADSFPEIVISTMESLSVNCGNPNCDENLRGAPRDLILCPKCNRTIQTRCGNLECQADDLNNKEKYPTINKPSPDKSCPVCNKDLMTRWWKCVRHNEHFETDALSCPRCVTEHNDDPSKLTFYEVTSVKGVIKTHSCPGCIHEGRKGTDIYQLDFMDVYYSVQPHKVKRAEQIFFEKNQTLRGRCPRCEALLLPICPYHDRDHDRGDQNPHFVSRNVKDIFICTHNQDHASLKVFECRLCGLPLRQGSNYCNRCKSTIRPSSDRGTGQSPLESERLLEVDSIYPGLENEWDSTSRYRKSRSQSGMNKGPATLAVAHSASAFSSNASNTPSMEADLSQETAEFLKQLGKKLGYTDEDTKR